MLMAWGGAGSRRETVVELANITSWSDWAADYCATSDAPVLAVAEHHQPGANLGAALRHMYLAGWRPVWSPAVQSESSECGTDGGL